MVDVDVNDKADGWETINKLKAEGKLLPKTVCQNTPSGGAHFLYKTDDPPRNKNAFLPGIDIRSEGYYVVVPPSIHPNGGTYAWAPGLSPKECELDEYPDFMRSQKTVAALPSPPPMPSLAAAKGNLGERPRLYLATCEPAVQGLGGHDKLLWASSAMVHGFQLSDDRAYEVLSQHYNPMCSPPWDLDDPQDQKDFRRKVTEARKNPPRDKQPGWLLDNPAYASIDNVTPEFMASVHDMVARHKAENAPEQVPETAVEISNGADYPEIRPLETFPGNCLFS